MAFRADEAAEVGLQKAMRYLVGPGISQEKRKASEDFIRGIAEKYGPVVDGYPSWHPLVTHHNDRQPVTWPGEHCGYKGLDHTIGFAHAFITCPYHDGEQVLESVGKLPFHPAADVTAERIDVPLYAAGTVPVLVRCEWDEGRWDAGDGSRHYVPTKLAVPLMMEKELPGWRWASRAETWETMRPYLLGSPHGNRSSLFVTQETALAMKRIFVAMAASGMYGPSK